MSKGKIIKSGQNTVRLETVQEIVAYKYSLKVRDLKGPRRSACYAVPRQLSMYLASMMTEFPSRKIGQAFGRRTGSYVLYAKNKMQRKINDDPLFRRTVVKFQADIRAVEN